VSVPPSGLEIRDEDYEGPSAQLLIEALQAEYVDRYGGPDATPVDAAQFAPPAGRFVVAYLDGEPVAMGGLRRHEDGKGDGSDVEVKRMYVVPAARRRGLARLVLDALEARAGALGATRVILETGQRQPEAIRLYETSGYRRIEGFGHYRDAPMSLSFAKMLSPAR
jgi:GNAT superfamily N-acetyltransferase